MGFIEKITGSEQTKRYKDFQRRIKVLPKDYQDAWEEINTLFWSGTIIADKNFIDNMENILYLFEEASSDGQTVKEVLGDDIKGFCLAITGGENSPTYRDKWRKQLNKNVKEKLSKLDN